MTPGSETLWSVHSGQYCGMRRFASSTRSWKLRGSTIGASMRLLLTRYQVERVDQVALGVRRPDEVADVDEERDRAWLVAGVHLLDRDVLGTDLDARLPPVERLGDARADQGVGGRVVRLEDQVVYAAAELGPHAPLAPGGRERSEEHTSELQS